MSSVSSGVSNVARTRENPFAPEEKNIVGLPSRKAFPDAPGKRATIARKISADASCFA